MRDITDNGCIVAIVCNYNMRLLDCQVLLLGPLSWSKWDSLADAGSGHFGEANQQAILPNLRPIAVNSEIRFLAAVGSIMQNTFFLRRSMRINPD